LTRTRPRIDLAGELPLADALSALEPVDLFPAGSPHREEFQNDCRWALASARLDLALTQAGRDLSGAVDRDPSPVRVLLSTGLGAPPSAEPITEWLEIDPTLECKIDLSQRPSAEVLETLIETKAGQAIDLKAHYAGAGASETDDASTPSWVGDPDPDPAFYRTVIEALPEAVIQDPAVTEATHPLLEAVSDRVAWDGPIYSLAEFDTQPVEVGRWNLKPSRFETLERLFEFIDRARDRGLGLYGSG